MSFNKRKVFEFIALIGKKLLKPRRKLRRKPSISISNKSLKLNEKIKKKTGGLFNKKTS